LESLKYLINKPLLDGNEKKYINDVLDSGWLSQNGKYTKKLEYEFSKYLGVFGTVAVQSGTAALHVACKSVGVKNGDFVIVPNFTCGACVTAPILSGAIPVIMDIELDTLSLDLNNLENVFTAYKPRALILVHMYGYPAKYTIEIQKLCTQYNVALIEDCAEAHGATLNSKKVGLFGEVSIFSIRSDKMIGAGEGGLVSSVHQSTLEEARLYANRSAPYRRKGDPWMLAYYYNDLALNYALPEPLSALALAQLENLDRRIIMKREIASTYRDLLSSESRISMQKIMPNTEPVFWLNTILLDGFGFSKTYKIGKLLMEKGIEARPGFYPLSDQNFNVVRYGSQKTGSYVFENSIVLPSAVELANNSCEEIHNIVKILKDILSKFD